MSDFLEGGFSGRKIHFLDDWSKNSFFLSFFHFSLRFGCAPHFANPSDACGRIVGFPHLSPKIAHKFYIFRNKTVQIDATFNRDDKIGEFTLLQLLGKGEFSCLRIPKYCVFSGRTIVNSNVAQFCPINRAHFLEKLRQKSTCLDLHMYICTFKKLMFKFSFGVKILQYNIVNSCCIVLFVLHMLFCLLEEILKKFFFGHASL